MLLVALLEGTPPDIAGTLQQIVSTLGDLPGVLFKLVWDPALLKIPDWSYLQGVGPFAAFSGLRRVLELFAHGAVVVPRFTFAFNLPLVGHWELTQDFAWAIPIMAAFRASQFVFFLWCFAEGQVKQSPVLRSAGLTIGG